VHGRGYRRSLCGYVCGCACGDGDASCRRRSVFQRRSGGGGGAMSSRGRSCARGEARSPRVAGAETWPRNAVRRDWGQQGPEEKNKTLSRSGACRDGRSSRRLGDGRAQVGGGQIRQINDQLAAMWCVSAGANGAGANGAGSRRFVAQRATKGEGQDGGAGAGGSASGFSPGGLADRGEGCEVNRRRGWGDGGLRAWGDGVRADLEACPLPERWAARES
jgi:hypothetical protein